MGRPPKVKKAAALRYDAGRHSAPQVVASGQGVVAEKILETGREAGVPVVEDSDLCEVLGALPLGAEIPPELYQAVAEVLTFVYQAGRKYKQSRK